MGDFRFLKILMFSRSFSMIAIDKKGILLEKTILDFENEAVLNPTAIQNGNTVHLFYRAVRSGNYSSIGYCQLSRLNIVEERFTEPVIYPEYDSESHGVEDPRIVKIDDIYYLTYTAYDGVNALGALALSSDLRTFVKVGIIVPKITYQEFEEIIESRGDLDDCYSKHYSPAAIHKIVNKNNFVWDKDLVFFPRRINGKLHFLHRIKPDIQLVAIDHLEELTPEYWRNYVRHLDEHTVLQPRYEHESLHIGGGSPPIETPLGWLIIYHGVCKNANDEKIYSACVALLDLENPMKEIARLPYPLFKPEFDWELFGEVNNVCFPSGTSLVDDTLTIYYGAADKCIAYASISLSSLLFELMYNLNNYANKTA